jgi:hypothetical protein
MIIEKELVVDNSNGKVQQDNFIVLHLAPTDELVFDREKNLWVDKFQVRNYENYVYVVKTDGGTVFAKLTCVQRMLFKDITKDFTIADNGCSVGLWKHYFKKRFAKVNDGTKMAAYFYERVKN